MGERHGAQVALVGTRACVDAQVGHQVLLPHEGLAAMAARMRALTRVYAAVPLQVAQAHCLVPALLAVQQLTARQGAMLHNAATTRGRRREAMRWR